MNVATVICGTADSGVADGDTSTVTGAHALNTNKPHNTQQTQFRFDRIVDNLRPSL